MMRQKENLGAQILMLYALALLLMSPWIYYVWKHYEAWYLS